MAITSERLIELETPDLNHKQLVKQAANYLRNDIGLSVVITERTTQIEIPDVIGYRGGFSWLIECKASKADFLADKKKLFRINPEQGIGYYRFYLAPINMIKVGELPENWGLIEVFNDEGKLRNIRAKDSQPFYERNMQNEIAGLVSVMRRLQISATVFVTQDSEDK
ncbi:MAG TPA: hypothetical protein DCP47_01425 [Phycisphaerales bacterium]|nr:hypothetical protein [Phycisphaerales bacterium]